MPLFEPVFAELDAAGVRYVVVGGLATVLHGFETSFDWGGWEATRRDKLTLGLRATPGERPVDGCG